MYSKVASVFEPTDVAGLVEHALQINAASLSRHEVTIVRDFQQMPPAFVEKHKVLQILVNLIRNAKQAVDEAPGKEPKTVIFGLKFPRLQPREGDREGQRRGDSAERISTATSSDGFTTKKSGHGFGLHSGALSAKEMAARCGRKAPACAEAPPLHSSCRSSHTSG